MPNDKETDKKETPKIRSERFYEDDPENAFVVVSKGKDKDEKK